MLPAFTAAGPIPVDAIECKTAEESLERGGEGGSFASFTSLQCGREGESSGSLFSPQTFLVPEDEVGGKARKW